MSYNKTHRPKYRKLCDLTAVTDPLISALSATSLPDSAISVGDDMLNEIEILALLPGASADDTVTVKLWGYRKGSFLPRYLGALTLTAGTGAVTIDPESGTTLSSTPVADTIAITENYWTPALVAGNDQGNNRVATVHLDLMGLEYLYAECTALGGDDTGVKLYFAGL